MSQQRYKANPNGQNAADLASSAAKCYPNSNTVTNNHSRPSIYSSSGLDKPQSQIPPSSKMQQRLPDV